MIGIYGIFRKSDDKCMYVGESIDVDRRIYDHLRGNSINTNFNKTEYYGKTLETHDVDDKQYRLDREAYFIKTLNPELNIRRDRHWHLSEETKKKIKENHSHISGMKGKHHSEDAKKKIKENQPDKSGNKNPMYGKNAEYYMSPEAIKQHRNNLRLASLNRKWINNGTINKFVKPDELYQYLNNGWVLGMIK